MTSTHGQKFLHFGLPLETYSALSCQNGLFPCFRSLCTTIITYCIFFHSLAHCVLVVWRLEACGRNASGRRRRREDQCSMSIDSSSVEKQKQFTVVVEVHEGKFRCTNCAARGRLISAAPHHWLLAAGRPVVSAASKGTILQLLAFGRRFVVHILWAPIFSLVMNLTS